MSERKLIRISANHGIHSGHAVVPINETSDRVPIELDQLKPVGAPRYLKSEIGDGEANLDERVLGIWKAESIDAEAFIAYNSPDHFRSGNYIQFYNIIK